MVHIHKNLLTFFHAKTISNKQVLGDFCCLHSFYFKNNNNNISSFKKIKSFGLKKSFREFDYTFCII